MQHLQQVFLPKSTGKNNYLVVLSMYIFITWYKLVVVGLCSYKELSVGKYISAF